MQMNQPNGVKPKKGAQIKESRKLARGVKAKRV